MMQIMHRSESLFFYIDTFLISVAMFRSPNREWCNDRILLAFTYFLCFNFYVKKDVSRWIN